MAGISALSHAASIPRAVFSLHKPPHLQILYPLPIPSAWIVFLFSFNHPPGSSSLQLLASSLGHLPPHQEVTFPRELYLGVSSPSPYAKLLIEKTISNSFIHLSVNPPQRTSEVGSVIIPNL